MYSLIAGPCACVSVPDRVSALSMAPLSDGRALRLSWSPPRGDWESFSVLLWNISVVLVNQTISRPSREYLISSLGLGLVPGRPYRAEVTTHSGILGNAAHCEGRLGQFPFLLHHMSLVQISYRRHYSLTFDLQGGTLTSFLLVLLLLQSSNTTDYCSKICCTVSIHSYNSLCTNFNEKGRKRQIRTRDFSLHRIYFMTPHV